MGRIKRKKPKQKKHREQPGGVRENGRQAPLDASDFEAALAHERNGALDRAAAGYERFLKNFPQDPNAWFNLGRVRMGQGDLDGAATAFGLALAGRPQDPVCHATLGNVFHLQEKYDAALACFHQARKLTPELPGIDAAMANTLHRMNRPQAAIDALGRAVAADPSNPDLHHNLGHTLEKQGRIEEAVAVFRRAETAFPKNHRISLSLGNLLFSHGQADEAISALEKAIALAPHDTYALSTLAHKLHKLGRLREATAAYARMVAVNPDHPTAGHMLAALTGHQAEKAPTAYVKTTFDLMAERFEDHLVDELAYAAPALLRGVLDEAAGTATRFDHTLDMGCGTGLSGLAFGDITQRLTGIDLSPAMLAKAREKGVYAELVETDIVDFLDRAETAFDLFIAVDVMVYLGNLEPVFAAVRRRARPGAYWVFSTERCTTADFTLTHSGRYAHSRRYIEHLASGQGFGVALHRRDNLRREGENWVNGHLFVLRVSDP
ncbi:MAG: tetratricopeptide repeat protein [Desulfobacterales bacterium]|nr:tetratricopeptide repeat protein [Desulfobacterales bacterium]